MLRYSLQTHRKMSAPRPPGAGALSSSMMLARRTTTVSSISSAPARGFRQALIDRTHIRMRREANSMLLLERRDDCSPIHRTGRASACADMIDENRPKVVGAVSLVEDEYPPQMFARPMVIVRARLIQNQKPKSESDEAAARPSRRLPARQPARGWRERRRRSCASRPMRMSAG